MKTVLKNKKSNKKSSKPEKAPVKKKNSTKVKSSTKKKKKVKEDDEDESSSSSKCDSCTKKKCTHCQDKKKDKSKSKKEVEEKKLKSKSKKIKVKETEIPVLNMDRDGTLMLEPGTDDWYIKPIKKSSGVQFIHPEKKTMLIIFLKNTTSEDDPTDTEYTGVLLLEREGELHNILADAFYNSKKKALKSMNSAIETTVKEFMG